MERHAAQPTGEAGRAVVVSSCQKTVVSFVLWMACFYIVDHTLIGNTTSALIGGTTAIVVSVILRPV